MVSLVPQTKAANVSFKDVPKSHPNYTEIMYLLEMGVIEPAEKFGVNQKVTREEVAVMVAKAVGLDGKKSKTKFKDVLESRYSSGYINSAVNTGIIYGYPNGTFKPSNLVTRGHMAAFIANAFKLMGQADINFKDVPKGSTSYVAVKKLAYSNITSGYPDGTFKPNASLTKAHISAFLARTMIYQKMSSGTTSPPPTTDKTSLLKSGLELYGSDGEFLGVLTTDRYKSDSVFNEYGNYGSKYSTTSIWNKYGNYGSEYSTYGAFNKYSNDAPQMVLNGYVIGYVTTNPYTYQGIHPNNLYDELARGGY